jgi:hypothetical protein
VHQASSNNNDMSVFFNRKVVKPVKGGGKVPAVNPYGSSSKPSGMHDLQKQQSLNKNK